MVINYTHASLMGMMYMAFALGYRETAQDWPLKATHSLELAAATDGSDN